MSSTSNQKPPRVVAELGRPETAAETAARKAENSRRHRANQTFFNLMIALVASLGIVLFLVLVVVRPDQPATKPVDYQAVASQAQSGAAEKLVAPDLPDGWTSNAAGLTTGSDGIVTWTVGFLTPSRQYIGMVEGIAANPSWIAEQVQKSRSTSTKTIGGLEWKTYDRRDDSNPGNYAYSMTLDSGDVAMVLHGTATVQEFAVLAAAVKDDLGQAGE